MNRFHERDFTKHSKYFKSFNGDLPFVVHPNVTSSFLMSPSHWWPFCHYPTDLGCTKTPHTYWDSCLWHHGHSPNFGKNFFLTSIFQRILTLMTQTYLIQTCMSPHHPNPQIKIKHLETHQHQTSPVFCATPKLFEGQKKLATSTKMDPTSTLDPLGRISSAKSWRMAEE